MNSTMRPCTPTVQSAQSAAFSNAHSSDTVHRSEGSSLAATGGKRLSRNALRSQQPRMSGNRAQQLTWRSPGACVKRRERAVRQGKGAARAYKSQLNSRGPCDVHIGGQHATSSPTVGRQRPLRLCGYFSNSLPPGREGA